MFLYVNTKAFEVFEEQSPLFHLSDALYSVLELINAANAGSSSTEASTSSDDSSEDGSSTDLDALFSDFIGGGDSGVEADDAVDPGERLAPLLNAIELREHQKVAIKWMLWRENQQQKDYSSSGEAESVANPVRCRSAIVVSDWHLPNIRCLCRCGKYVGSARKNPITSIRSRKSPA